MICNSYYFVKNTADLVISSKCDKIYFKIFKFFHYITDITMYIIDNFLKHSAT